MSYFRTFYIFIFHHVPIMSSIKMIYFLFHYGMVMLFVHHIYDTLVIYIYIYVIHIYLPFYYALQVCPNFSVFSSLQFYIPVDCLRFYSYCISPLILHLYANF